MSHFTYQSEENYIKALYKISSKPLKKVNNIALAKTMNLNPATVLEMVRKLTERKLVQMLPDKTIQLTEKGKKKALLIIRKHRLWEVFLVEKLAYEWTEVHHLAEQLEHVESEDLVNRLDAFLGYPLFDPHGDPIPDKSGKLKAYVSLPLSAGETGKKYTVQSFGDTNDLFLEDLNKIDIKPGVKLVLDSINAYDQTYNITISKKSVQLSEKVAHNIFVKQG